jgi:hypothetical protein
MSFYSEASRGDLNLWVIEEESPKELKGSWSHLRWAEKLLKSLLEAR